MTFSLAYYSGLTLSAYKRIIPVFLDFFSGVLDDAGYTSSLMIVVVASISFGFKRFICTSW